MSQTYTYQIADDFPNAKVDLARLQSEIEQSGILGFSYLESSDINVGITFVDSLSEADNTTLDTIIHSHSGNPLPAVGNKDMAGNDVVAVSIYGYVKDITCFHGYRYQTTPGATTIFDERIEKQIYMQGGKGTITNAHDGDYVEFAVVDKDNILGMFGMYGLTVGTDVIELSKYVKKYYPSPGVVDVIENKVEAVAAVMQGLYLRIIYHSVAPSDADPAVVRVTYLWYESHT